MVERIPWSRISAQIAEWCVRKDLCNETVISRVCADSRAECAKIILHAEYLPLLESKKLMCLQRLRFMQQDRKVPGSIPPAATRRHKSCSPWNYSLGTGPSQEQ